MEDKLSRKRVKVDYKNLIKGHGLWFVFKSWCNQRQRKVKSSNRLMYQFCLAYLRSELDTVRSFNFDIETNIRLAQDHSWIEED